MQYKVLDESNRICFTSYRKNSSSLKTSSLTVL